MRNSPVHDTKRAEKFLLKHWEFRFLVHLHLFPRWYPAAKLLGFAPPAARHSASKRNLSHVCPFNRPSPLPSSRNSAHNAKQKDCQRHLCAQLLVVFLTEYPKAFRLPTRSLTAVQKNTWGLVLASTQHLDFILRQRKGYRVIFRKEELLLQDVC